jgi:hypothetical protein
MKEKKKHDDSSAGTQVALRSESMTGKQRAFVADKEEAGIRDRIARRAYELYETRGRSDGEDLNDWLKAEAEVRASLSGPDRREVDLTKRRHTASRADRQ